MEDRAPNRIEAKQRAGARRLGLILAVVIVALLALPILLRVL